VGVNSGGGGNKNRDNFVDLSIYLKPVHELVHGILCVTMVERSKRMIAGMTMILSTQYTQITFFADVSSRKSYKYRKNLFLPHKTMKQIHNCSK